MLRAKGHQRGGRAPWNWLQLSTPSSEQDGSVLASLFTAVTENLTTTIVEEEMFI